MWGFEMQGIEMRGFAKALIGLMVAAAVPSIGRCSEATEQQAIATNVGNLLAAERFAELDALEATYLDQKQRTSSGNRKLSFFYSRIRSFKAMKGGDGGDITEPLLRRWLAASPNVPAPCIALAYMFYTRGLTLRGGDVASRVPAENWPRIEADMAAATGVLNTCKRYASRDPAWYNLTLKVMLYRTPGDRKFDAMMLEGTTRHPNYEAIWFNAANYYMPQWNGDAAAMDRIARRAMARTRSTDGTGLYARVYLYLQDLWFRDRLFSETDADAALMIQSMRDIAKRYPSDSNFVDFAEVACLAGDQAEADRYAGLIKDADARAGLAKARAKCSGRAPVDPSARVAAGVSDNNHRGGGS